MSKCMELMTTLREETRAIDRLINRESIDQDTTDELCRIARELEDLRKELTIIFMEGER